MWQIIVGLKVSECPVVQARHINQGCKAIVKHTRNLVHTTGAHPCRILSMADILKEFGHLISLDITLGRDLVTDTPERYARIVSPTTQHSDHISFCPGNSLNIRFFIKEPMVAVPTFCNIPFIERLNHHHKTELITKFHEFRSRHIMRCADCIATHILKNKQLVPEGSNIDCCAQRSQVVVIADSLELAGLSIEEETFFGNEFHSAEAKTRLIDICKSLSVIEFRNCLIEIRSFRGPKQRRLDYEILHKRLSFACLSCKGFLCHFVSVGSIDRSLDFQGASCTAFDFSFEMNRGIGFFYMGSRDMCSPNGYMDLVGGNQVNISIEPCSRVPA